MKVNPYAPSETIFKNAFENALSTNSTNKTNQINSISKDSTSENENKISFSSALKSAIDAINDKQVQADKLTDSFVKGEDGVDITDVMLSTAEANTSLQYAVQVRNKLLDAYQEIAKMQI